MANWVERFRQSKHRLPDEVGSSGLNEAAVQRLARNSWTAYLYALAMGDILGLRYTCSWRVPSQYAYS